MKRSVHHNYEAFKGLGYLIGYSIALIFALISYFLSKTFVIAIAVYVPIGTTLGILFEQKLNKHNAEINPRSTKAFIALLLLGIVVFISLFFFVIH